MLKCYCLVTFCPDCGLNHVLLRAKPILYNTTMQYKCEYMQHYYIKHSASILDSSTNLYLKFFKSPFGIDALLSTRWDILCLAPNIRWKNANTTLVVIPTKSKIDNTIMFYTRDVNTQQPSP